MLTLGRFRHSDLNQRIEVEDGDDVTLQGRLDNSTNLSSYTFDVARLDLGIYGDVYSYRRGKDHLDDQMDRYRDRTTLNHEDLIRGIVTLKISSVTLSDSGSYKVYVPKLEASFIVNIIVEGENVKAARAHIAPIVVPVLVAVIGVIIVLVKLGIMQKYTRQFRERRNHQAETANAAELSDDLIDQKPVLDLGGLAADHTGNHEEVV
ncbi:hypothetical protein PFLUV_G00002580 [Perca fluviatilis]|uniref:Immunoglobulin V-set domain-containing protein n=1 Tax=Perca fluviatilis TaxID=8168 RepID=A0A6A5FG92_PERFL|nr:hypothetical protein PFLUV_G00002580 [Perca fluviatilis]